MSRAVIREMRPQERAEVASFTRLAPCESEERACALVALRENAVVGYAEVAPAFFGRQFVSLLSVHPGHRRQGLATALMKAVESRCKESKLFTSTNLSNQPMQSLLANMGYRLCGVVEELDEGDPELVFVKRLRNPESTP